MDKHQLGFDFCETATDDDPVVAVPDFICRPQNDNDRLMNLQYQFRTGKQESLNDIYILSVRICRKMIVQQMHKKGFRLSFDDIQEKAHNAAAYLVMQYKTRDDFVITKSTIAYLFLRVRHELYYRKKTDEIVDYVDISTLRRIEDEQ